MKSRPFTRQEYNRQLASETLECQDCGEILHHCFTLGLFRHKDGRTRCYGELSESQIQEQAELLRNS